MPERHGGDLRVEQRNRHLAGEIVDDLQVLAAGVKDLEHLMLLDQQVEQGAEVEVCLGIDRGRFVGSRDLDQAEVRPIGVFAHELRVDSDERVRGHPLDQLGEVVGFGDERVNLHVLCGGHSDPLAG